MTSTSKETSTNKFLEKEKENQKEQTPSKSPISLDLTNKTLGYFKLDYDVVEDLKKMKANINVFESCKITQLREKSRESLQHIQGPQDVAIGSSKATLKGKNTKATKLAKTSSVASTSSVEKKEKTTMDKKQLDPKEYGAPIRRKSRSLTPTFLLTFDIFKRNVHNFLVDSRASSNMMPYSVYKKLNVEPKM